MTREKYPRTLPHFRFRKTYCYLLLVGICTLLLSSRGLWDEGAISFNRDMARYLMNGVLVHDYLMNGLPQNPYTFAEQYFATLPALSIGHHPILIAFALAPFYAIFGVSVVSAKLMVVSFALLAAMSFYFLVKLLYEEDVALLATLLFLTNAFVVKLSMSVMSEIPAFAFLFLAAYNFFVYLQDEKSSNLIQFLVFFSMGLLAKQTTIVMLPIYGCCFISAKGWKTIFTRKALFLAATFALAMIPIVVITLVYSQHNVNWTVEAVRHSLDMSRLSELSARLWGSVLSKPLAGLCLVAFAMAVWKRKIGSMLLAGCMLWFFIFFVVTHAPFSRHMIFIVPFAAMLGASLIVAFKDKRSKWACGFLVLTVLAYQLVAAYNEKMPRTYGYEAAAKYIDANWKGDSVMYVSSVDVGYFIFFFRKTTRHVNRVVIRADKTLVTSLTDNILQDHAKYRQHIYSVMQKYGIYHIVVENHDLRSQPLNWLRDELQRGPFVLRERIPMSSSEPRLNEKYLYVYGYLDATPADPSDVLELRIPGGSIKMPFGDLMDQDATEQIMNQN